MKKMTFVAQGSQKPGLRRQLSSRREAEEGAAMSFLLMLTVLCTEAPYSCAVIPEPHLQWEAGKRRYLPVSHGVAGIAARMGPEGPVSCLRDRQQLPQEPLLSTEAAVATKVWKQYKPFLENPKTQTICESAIGTLGATQASLHHLRTSRPFLESNMTFFP